MSVETEDLTPKGFGVFPASFDVYHRKKTMIGLVSVY